MSIRSSVLLLAAILLAPLPAGSRSAQAPSASEAAQQVTQLEDRWLARESDPALLESILADDFVHVVSSGMISKAEHIAYIRQHPFKDASRHFEALHVRIYGTVGIVNGIVFATAADGKTRKFAFTDVFAYRARKWQAVNAQELPLTPSQ